MDEDASLSVLDADNSKNALSVDWISFLAEPEVGLSASVTSQTSPATGSTPRRNIIFGFENSLNELSGLIFSSENNSVDFKLDSLDVPGSVLAGLGTISSPTWNVGLGALLDLLEVRPKGTGQIPDNFGQLPSSSGAPKPDKAVSLLSFLVDKLGEAQALQVDSSAGARNGVWLTPGQRFRSDVILTLVLAKGAADTLSQIQTEIVSQFGLHPDAGVNFKDFKIIIQRTSSGAQYIDSSNQMKWTVNNTYRLTFNIGLGPFMLWVILEPIGMSLSVTTSASAGDLLELAGFDAEKVSPVLDGVLDNIHVLNLSAGKDHESGVWWRITIVVAWKDAAQIYLQYDSRTKTFVGGLVLDGFYVAQEDKLLPTYRPGQDLENFSTTDPPPSYDIRQFSSEMKTIPSIMPTAIAEGEVGYDIDSKTLWVSVKLTRPPQTVITDPSVKTVPSPFTWDELDLRMSKGPGDFSAAAATTAMIRSPSGHAASLALAVEYHSLNKQWDISGYALNLSGELLADFFDPLYKDALLQVLGKLKIPSIALTYTYEQGSQDSPGPASSFVIVGIVEIGLLQLRMFYQYASSILTQPSAADRLKQSSGSANDLPPTLEPVTPLEGGASNTEWRFECDLQASAPNQSVGSVIASLAEDAAKVLPQFVADISFPAANGANDRSPIAIKVQKTSDKKILFSFRVVIGSFTLTFAQVSIPTTPGQAPLPTPKRLFRFSCDKIPLIKDIPLLGELPQPFDQLEYLWHNGATEADGLLSSEVDALNQFVLTGNDQLYYRKLVGQAANTPPVTKPNVVILPGHHFMVVNNGSAVVDHVFHSSSSSADSDKAVTRSASKSTDTSHATPTSTPSKGALVFSEGPLTISAITLQFKEDSDGQFLWITMDATFILGPITFSLLGFGIGAPLSTIRLDKLADMFDKIAVTLDGLAFAFDKPPLLIAGGFEHQKTSDRELFMGGIGVSFPPYTFVGLGAYTILNTYKSVFLYAKLDGPLVTLEFATISGVRLGLGFNSAVRTPTIDQITEFPFINDKAVSGAGNNPMTILKQIMQPPSGDPWIFPKPDSYWFAAGLTVVAFDILTVTAVAMLAFRDSGLIISLYADAIAQMPPGVTNTSEMIIYVEIGLLAEMNFADGYFMVEASLAPASFLLVPQCHLYGQFAMTYWFPPNTHAGDWVFSVGGYHPKFQPPAWYPKPKRLGISFQTMGISITGESYFAITPSVLMGGAMLRASLSVGPVSAWLDATFDALINLHPLHYTVDFHVSIGIDCHIDIWFIHIHVTASVGAQLHIEGPDFGGSAYVDFYLFGFTVYFGSDNDTKPALSLLEFWEMLHKPGPDASSTNQNDPYPPRSLVTFSGNPPLTNLDGAAFKFSLEEGNFPLPKKADENDKSNPASTGAGQEWFVKGGSFRFRVNSDFAISDATVAAPDDGKTIALSLPDDQAIYSRPMRVSTPIKSTLTIRIKEAGPNGAVIGGWRRVTFDTKALPIASWGIYSEKTDPTSRHLDTNLLLSNTSNPTTPLPTGLIITAPPPELAPSFIPVFDASNYTTMRVRDFRADPKGNGTDWPIPDLEPQQTTYLAATLTKEEKAMDQKTIYKKFEDTWKGLAAKQSEVADPVNGLLAQFTSLLEWDKDRPQMAPVVVSGGGEGGSGGTSVTADVLARRVAGPSGAGGVVGAGAAGGASGTGATTPPARVVEVPTSTAWKLQVDFPVRLLARFEDKYLELPRMAVVGA